MDPVLNREVEKARAHNRPVVALESTIISHGMPYPTNLEVAAAAEERIRAAGVCPATIAVLDGAVRVGLERHEIEELATAKGLMKISRRDLGWAVSGRKSGATTVCATMLIADLAGIAVFATGGIGGVHRGVSESWDVSADLEELARTPVVVVSAGAKAILDIRKTLEYLETRGVPVIGYRTSEMPAFYSRSSGIGLDLRAETPQEIVRTYWACRELGLPNGLLVANPIPPEHEIPATVVEPHIEAAIAEMEGSGVRGKEVTPFLLSRVAELSEGDSLDANIRLLWNNIDLGCQIAKTLGAVSR